MSAYGLDADGDMHAQGGNLVRVTESAEVAQKVATVLRSYRGDWWLDLLHGLPWIQEILGEGGPRGDSEDQIRRAIVGVPGVESLETFDAFFDGVVRDARIEFRAETAFGTTGEIVVDV